MTLKYLIENQEEVYRQLDSYSLDLVENLNKIFIRKGIPHLIQRIGINDWFIFYGTKKNCFF